MRKLNYVDILEISAIILLAIYFFLVVSRWGASWDNIVGYYNTLTMAGKASYYEILREPLAQLILLPGAALNIPMADDILIAQVFLAAFLLFCTKKLANSLKVEGVSAYLISLSLTVIIFMFILNLTDVFGLATAILAFAYYFDDDYTKSSIVFGLSFLAKFTNLIFLPCMLFMFRGKWRAKSVAIALLVNVPWFIANYWLYGNPIYGFELSNQVFSGQHIFTISNVLTAIGSLAFLLETIIILAVIIIIFARIKKLKLREIAGGINRTDMIVFGFTLFEAVYVGSAQNYVPWLMYPLLVALTIMAFKALSRIKLKGNEAVSINLLYFALLLSSLLPLIYYTTVPASSLDWQLWFSKNHAYTDAIGISAASSCGTVYSNAWPYLMVYNMGVKPLYQINSSIISGSCLVVFNPTSVGVSMNLSGAVYTTIENSSNYSIVRYEGQAT